MTMLALPTLAETMDEYIKHETRRGLMPRGIDAYRRDLADVQRFFGPDMTPADLTPASIADYHDHMLARGLAPATISSRLSALRAYSRWCIAAGLRADDPTVMVVYPKLPDYLPRPLSSEQLAAIAELCQRGPDASVHANRRRTWARNIVAVAVLIYTGARLSEAAGLVYADVDFGRGWVTIRGGKGGRSRIVPLHPALKRLLLATPESERRPDCPLIAGRKGRPLGPKSLAHIFERWLPEACGVDATAHQFRHSYATLMREAGYDLDTIGELLGHRDPKTTRIYAKLPDRARREAVMSLPDITAKLDATSAAPQAIQQV